MAATLLVCSQGCDDGHYHRDGYGLFACTVCGHQIVWEDVLPDADEIIVITQDGLLAVTSQ